MWGPTTPDNAAVDRLQDKLSQAEARLRHLTTVNRDLMDKASFKDDTDLSDKCAGLLSRDAQYFTPQDRKLMRDLAEWAYKICSSAPADRMYRSRITQVLGDPASIMTLAEAEQFLFVT